MGKYCNKTQNTARFPDTVFFFLHFNINIDSFSSPVFSLQCAFTLSHID